MSVHKKLMQARIALQSKQLKKSGVNKFAGYDYFELGDFLPTIQQIFAEIGLCGTIKFEQQAELTIVDTDKPESSIVFSCPIAQASLKGCHEVQNLGASMTYIRRYLWVNALEIVEHDALDATTGKGKVTPTAGAWEAMDEESQQFLTDIAMEVISLLDKGDAVGAVQHIKDQNLDADEKTALWTRFDSKQRSAMSKLEKK